MRFSTRNSYYLRISATTVLPLYLYLDDRHVEWMSERVLQHVLADLRPLIIPKLNAEADAQLGPGGSTNAKRGTLDVHRGDTYQFGYFLRGTEPHAILVKTRMFTATPPQPPRVPLSLQESPQKLNEPPTDKSRPKNKNKAKGRSKEKGGARDTEGEAIFILSDDAGGGTFEPLARRRSKRAKKVISGAYRDDDDTYEIPSTEGEHPGIAENDDGDYDPLGIEQPDRDTSCVAPKREETEPSLTAEAPEAMPIEVNEDEEGNLSTLSVEFAEDEEESKPKPILNLHYHGFNIHGRCLCVIVEPYPPLRSTSRALSLAPTGLVAPGRAPSMAPPEVSFGGCAAQRERTPLFLPDFYRDTTTAPARTLPQVPLFTPAIEDSDWEDGEMVLYSQILRSVGEHPPGIAEDEDEIDGAVFFGDADETREL